MSLAVPPQSRRAPRAPCAGRAGRAGRALVTGTLTLLVALGAAPGASAAARQDVAGRSAPTADAAASVLEGIDVSHWQNTIDWPKVAAAGKAFAIIKATEGTTYVDPTYLTNQAGAKAAGMWTGAYHFARPDAGPNDAVLEAAHFASKVNLGAGDLRPALDLEASGGLSVAALQTWVATFLEEVRVRTGVRAMIYTSPAFWKKYMGDSRALADAGYNVLWVARWGVSAPTVPASNWGGHGWTFSQYSNCGSVPGISGCVDLDRFNGTDLAPHAYSNFKLSGSAPAGGVKQGRAAEAAVGIARTNFTAEVDLDVTGLPEGATAAFGADPAGGTSTTLTITLPEDPAATPVGTYPLVISGVAEGLTRTVPMNLVVADGIAPTVVAPFTSLVTGRSMGSTSIPVRVWWSASDPSGIASHGLQRRVDGGSWVNVRLPSATATAVDQAITVGAAVQQRARSTDGNANTSAYVAGPIVRSMLTQQSGPAVRYSGSWTTVSRASASGGSVRTASSAGASATYTFTGSSIGWVATRGPGRGSARVYVDGVYAATVNLYAASGQSRVVVFARNWRTVGSHTLRIVVVGTAGHPRVEVDAFIRLAL